MLKIQPFPQAMGNHPRVLSKEVMLGDIFSKDYKSSSWETGLQAAVNWKLLGSHRNHPGAKLSTRVLTTELEAWDQV